MPFITAGQSKIYYEEYGEGPAIVLAHGVGGNHASWFNQIPTFSKSYRVITFDQRAFGNSDDVEGVGRSAFVDDLKALLDQLDISRTALIGQSMGGGTVAAFTCRYPQRVGALVHCDSLAGVKLDEPYASRYRKLADETYNLSQVERVLGPTTRANDPERTLLYLQIASFNSVSLKTVKGAPAPWSPQEVAATGTPVMFLVGEEDVIAPPEFVRAMHDQVPGSRFVEIKKSGHSAYFETPAEFNRVVLEYLASVGHA
jgi:pimeloyl-ACP methyl ester carboxylesterase